MNISYDPSGKLSPHAPLEPVSRPPADPVELLLAIREGLCAEVIRPTWQPNVNILSTQPINQTRESTHV